MDEEKNVGRTVNILYGKEFLWRLMQADKFPVGVTKHKLSTLNKSLLLELVKTYALSESDHQLNFIESLIDFC